jgi:hypothetical protein
MAASASRAYTIAGRKRSKGSPPEVPTIICLTVRIPTFRFGYPAV